MPLPRRRRALERRAFQAYLVCVATLPLRAALAQGCSSPPASSPCFDANSLWLPAGKSAFMSLPDTRVLAPHTISFGLATELLHGPVLAHVASPDSDGRDVRIIDYALDATLLVALGVLPNLEGSVALPTRIYQRGSGAGGLTSQSSPPVEQSALRDPRLGLAYSFDSALKMHGTGLRASLDASLPLGDESAFAGERGLVIVPSLTFGLRAGPVAFRAGAGARLREAVEFADVRLGNQAFIALGVGVDALSPDLLFFSLEGYALPPLASSKAATANPAVESTSLVQAEWLLSARTCFRPNSEWSLAASVGTGLPFSSETHASASGPSTSYFSGLTEPEWRALLIVRFAPR